MWRETVEIINRGNLDTDKAVYPMLLRPSAFDKNSEAKHAMLFHFAMWLSANPAVQDYRIMADGITLESPIIEIRGHPIWILFGKKTDRTAFKKWLARYKNWFGGKPIEENLLPEFPENGRVCVSIVCTPFMRNDFGSSEYPEGFVERWAWVIQHCKKPVFLMPTRGLAFTNLNEAIHFKLKW
jgi:hypothetical protein